MVVITPGGSTTPESADLDVAGVLVIITEKVGHRKRPVQAAPPEADWEAPDLLAALSA
ncbi:hypothetical protein ABZ569_20165 [Streptomyces albus]|uniref:hypothetical protein n=1 Tax=Streptomyces albus TaxID=1888 RepID=UPI0033F083FF